MRYAIYAFAVIACVALLEWRGVNLLPTSQRAAAPSASRGASGGYRSYHTFHSFHGGK